ncbi:UPF0149 family protein [Thorsellia anophelis]|uniref:Uncharacterized protein n=1 Tax=Thorsellia anophelis DSM 18579 TaxID=1123402 RepID=A0A1I0A5Y6_9GAMM|nr:UPF0149 family protein [Thorsellia anophelis]SES89585.1 hypothetical protein SAMN02583745_00803 [Thorsellia anophelis DSM 18579]
MSSTSSIFNYELIDSLLRTHQIALTPSEIHGLMTGLLVGESNSVTRMTLMYELTNDGLAFENELQVTLEKLFSHSLSELSAGEFAFELLIESENEIFDKIDGLSEWVNHFLLGLGVTQPNINKLEGEGAEVFADLREIAQLGYDGSEDANTLEHAYEDIYGYIKMSVILFFDLFKHTPNLSQSPLGSKGHTIH